MMKFIGVVATITVLSGGFAMYKGWLKADVSVTEQGKKDARQAANEALESAKKAINDGLTTAQNEVGQ